MERIIFFIYLGMLAFLSLITFVLYGKDKQMAKKQNGAVRIKEKTLLGFTAIGGATGAFLGRLAFHHKTDKKYFSLVIFFSLIVEVLTALALIYFAFMR